MIQPTQCNILLVDDEEGIRFTLGCILKKEGYQVDVAAGHVDAIICLQSTQYDMALVDIMLGGESGIDVLHDIKAISPTTPVVMFTARPEVATAAEAVRLGAFDYITKPVQPKTLISVTRLALNEKMMNDERDLYRRNMDAIFRSVTDAIIMVDREGRLVTFNATAENLCGYLREQIGVAISDIGAECCMTCRSALLETVRTNVPRELRRLECRRPGGDMCIVSIRSTPVTDANGTACGAVAVVRDETPLVVLERSLKQRGQFSGIIGVSEVMQRVYSLIEALADVPTTVLLLGESGTGKELVAAALHHTGTRSLGPFVKVNCSALSESLLESELFGHVRGAFTGAVADKVGRFQMAHRGTLFLDEIGDVSPAVQMRLLRVLQESEIERVGESRSIKIDVRIIAATNKNLLEMVNQGIFRHDLYYRLNVVKMELPSLHQRREDIGLLAEHFMVKFNQKFSKNIQGISEDVMKLFRSYSWPGNVREMEHAIEHAVILCRNEVISLQNLPQDLVNAVLGSKKLVVQISAKDISLDQALSLSNGNITQAARLLGVSRPTVYRHLKEGGE